MGDLELGDMATWASTVLALAALTLASVSIRHAGRANKLAESANRISDAANRRGEQVELRQVECVDVRWQSTIDNQGYMVFKNVGIDTANSIRIEAKIFIPSNDPEFIPFQVVEEKDFDSRISGNWWAIQGMKKCLGPHEVLGIPTARGTVFDFSGLHGNDRRWGLSASIWWSTEHGAPRHSKLFAKMLVVSGVADVFPPLSDVIGPYLDSTALFPEAISPIRTAQEVRDSVRAATSASTLANIERAQFSATDHAAM